MRMVELIEHKKQNKALTAEEIAFMIGGYVSGEIPDYQMSAMLMAICFNGLNPEEAYLLTREMVASGEVLAFPEITGVKVDKHSTGGVGDKVSLILSPMVACFDVPMIKMSGRGLGITGGTIDKLESIPHLKTELGRDTVIRTVQEVGFSISGQTGNLVPADKLLYALRDVTATVDSIPLIASSIVSKKIASGADAIILDVKFGRGAFMKDRDAARDLARAMIEIGERFGRRFTGILTDMNQPLGRMVGNALEVYESLEILRGEGDPVLGQFCTELAAHLLVMAGRFTDQAKAEEAIRQVVANGQAYDKFIAYVRASGGDAEVIQDKSWFFQAAYQREIHASATGYLASIDANTVGEAAVRCGSGRSRKEDQIDPFAGIELCKMPGEAVAPNDVLAIIYSGRPIADEEVASLGQAFSLSDTPIVATRSLIHEVI